MSRLHETPSGERVHISLFGRRNAGKSSLINAITGQSLAIVSEQKGTTTDPVSKAMELLPLGPVLVTDTPGLDDEGELGALRVEKARQVLGKTDIALLVVDAWAAGRSGYELAELLRRNRVEPEYADPDEVVLMYAADAVASDFQSVETAFSSFRPGPSRVPAALPAPGERVLSPRAAMLSPWEEVPVGASAGRICAGAAVSCPPAIPIAVSGERITPEAAALMAELGFDSVSVVREPI